MTAGLSSAGRDLLPVAWCADETIEVIGMPDRFGYGVRWHPEADPSGDRLFGALAGAARKALCEGRAVA